MVDEHDDRPDVVVPTGPLRGHDLRHLRFAVTFRGYRMSEVDALLARLASELEERHEDRPGDEPGPGPDSSASSGEPPRV